VRGLINRAELRPAPEGPGLEVEFTGELSAMLRLGGEAASDGQSQPPRRWGGAGSDLFVSSVQVVAGTGFEPVTFRL
jgi:site-specific DNA recombinase